MEAIESTQTYIHKFQSGNDLKVIVDFSAPMIKIFGQKVDPIDYPEYVEWVSQIFMPSVHGRASLEQLKNLAIYGLNSL